MGLLASLFPNLTGSGASNSAFSMNQFKARQDILPPPQRRLWGELSGSIPKSFVLYGGTAISVRLAHRPSLDFDFFCTDSFQPGELFTTLPWKSEAEPIQSSPNTLTLL